MILEKNASKARSFLSHSTVYSSEENSKGREGSLEHPRIYTLEASAILERLRSYFKIYYSDLFCSIDPIILEYLEEEGGKVSYCLIPLEDRNTGSTFNLEDRDICFQSFISIPFLLAFYKSQTGYLNSIFILPLSAVGNNSSDSLTEDTLSILMNISEDSLKVKRAEINSIKEELNIKLDSYKYGMLQEFDERLKRLIDKNTLLAVYFDDDNDFSLYELNFNCSLNYL